MNKPGTKVMEQSLNDLENLAESIALDYMVDGKVNLEKIINDRNILLVYGNYGENFLGLLVHENGRFYIQVNLDKLANRPGRTRFTLAHELGHFFTDSHRIQLEKGVSISYYSDSSCNSNIVGERQANHFASSLLMPKVVYLPLASKYEPGFRSIMALKYAFDTSIESTAIRYAALDAAPCLIVKWKPDLTYKNSFYSKSFAELTGIQGKPSIKITKDYISNVISQMDFDPHALMYNETVTQLSKWVASVAPNSKKDLTGLEQTMKLGSYGAMTLLLFTQ